MRRAFVLSFVLAACGGNRPTTPAPPPVIPAAEAAASTPPPPSPRHGDYPDTRREAVVDRLHGIDVRDPYRWLEDARAPEVQAWMKAQDDYARMRLAKLPGRDALAARLRELFYRESISAPRRRGDRLFYVREHKDKEKAVVYWKQGEAGVEKILLDPNTWSTDGSSGLRGWQVSWDGKYVAYNVSEHNADETEMKVAEVATGKVLPDTIPGTRFGGASWSPDGRGFYYSWTPPASDRLREPDRNAQTELRYHRLGSDPTKDVTI